MQCNVPGAAPKFRLRNVGIVYIEHRIFEMHVDEGYVEYSRVNDGGAHC